MTRDELRAICAEITAEIREAEERGDGKRVDALLREKREFLATYYIADITFIGEEGEATA